MAKLRGNKPWPQAQQKGRRWGSCVGLENLIERLLTGFLGFGERLFGLCHPVYDQFERSLDLVGVEWLPTL